MAKKLSKATDTSTRSRGRPRKTETETPAAPIQPSVITIDDSQPPRPRGNIKTAHTTRIQVPVQSTSAVLQRRTKRLAIEISDSEEEDDTTVFRRPVAPSTSKKSITPVTTPNSKLAPLRAGSVIDIDYFYPDSQANMAATKKTSSPLFTDFIEESISPVRQLRSYFCKAPKPESPLVASFGSCGSAKRKQKRLFAKEDDCAGSQQEAEQIEEKKENVAENESQPGEKVNFGEILKIFDSQLGPIRSKKPKEVPKVVLHSTSQAPLSFKSDENFGPAVCRSFNNAAVETVEAVESQISRKKNVVIAKGEGEIPTASEAPKFTLGRSYDCEATFEAVDNHIAAKKRNNSMAKNVSVAQHAQHPREVPKVPIGMSVIESQSVAKKAKITSASTQNQPAISRESSFIAHGLSLPPRMPPVNVLVAPAVTMKQPVGPRKQLISPPTLPVHTAVSQTQGMTSPLFVVKQLPIRPKSPVNAIVTLDQDKKPPSAEVDEFDEMDLEDIELEDLNLEELEQAGLLPTGTVSELKIVTPSPPKPPTPAVEASIDAPNEITFDDDFDDDDLLELEEVCNIEMAKQAKDTSDHDIRIVESTKMATNQRSAPKTHFQSLQSRGNNKESTPLPPDRRRLSIFQIPAPPSVTPIARPSKSKLDVDSRPSEMCDLDENLEMLLDDSLELITDEELLAGVIANRETVVERVSLVVPKRVATKVSTTPGLIDCSMMSEEEMFKLIEANIAEDIILEDLIELGSDI